METIEPGTTGLMVSAVGFGGIPIQRLSEEEAVRVVRHCLDLGVTFFGHRPRLYHQPGEVGVGEPRNAVGVGIASRVQARAAGAALGRRAEVIGEPDALRRKPVEIS